MPFVQAQGGVALLSLREAATAGGGSNARWRQVEYSEVGSIFQVGGGLDLRLTERLAARFTASWANIYVDETRIPFARITVGAVVGIGDATRPPRTHSQW